MQNGPTRIGFAITAAASAIVGMIPIAIFASAENGYVAGYLALPILFLMVTLFIVIGITAVVFIAKDKFAIALYLILSIFLGPAFAFGFAQAATHFGIGAYRIEPVRPFPIQ
jgi:hypothetical protein